MKEYFKLTWACWAGWAFVQLLSLSTGTFNIMGSIISFIIILLITLGAIKLGKYLKKKYQ